MIIGSVTLLHDVCACLLDRVIPKVPTLFRLVTTFYSIIDLDAAGSAHKFLTHGPAGRSAASFRGTRRTHGRTSVEKVFGKFRRTVN